jgi:translation initiation factor 2A
MASRVSVVDASLGHVITTLPTPNVFELGFSPLGTYIITWQRYTKDEEGNAVKNLKVWRTTSEEGDDQTHPLVGEYVQKNQTGWNLQYTSDEKFCARTVTNEVQFYQSHDLRTVWNKLRVEGVTDFAVSPGKNHSVAVFVPERKVSLRFAMGRLGANITSGHARRGQGLPGAPVRRARITEDLLQGRQGPAEVEQPRH